ncbi:hypothetical protein DPMN_089678 [Dreissena polymorpha]|uniref:Uncharacterized protein n=1 Tax=Dreissena polymorpha TaxID=45954 RepID=A0A9D4KWD8_DREPO|nr:hypothetical protein DPMN_089678 [Dreissena polymorpha]
MSKAKLFKESTIFVNEDLTKLNAEVLTSLRLKQPGAVERSWSFEGKLYAVFKGNQQTNANETLGIQSLARKAVAKKILLREFRKPS